MNQTTVPTRGMARRILTPRERQQVHQAFRQLYGNRENLERKRDGYQPKSWFDVDEKQLDSGAFLYVKKIPATSQDPLAFYWWISAPQDNGHADD